MKKNTSSLLAEYGVSEKQYVIWAWQRFRKQAFWSGIGIGILFMSPVLWAAYSAYLEGNVQDFWGMLIAAAFVGLIFLIGAFWVKSTAIDYPFDPAYTPKGFEALDVSRRTDPKYINKLKAYHWDAVRAIDVKEVERKEAAKRPGPREGVSKERIKNLIEIKSKMKKWGLIGAVLFSVALITFPLYLSYLIAKSLSGILITVVLGILFFVATIGLHGWLLLYGYLAYLKREIRLYGEFAWDDTIHHGKSATVFGVVAMGVAIVSFSTFMLIPIALLLGWE